MTFLADPNYVPALATQAIGPTPSLGEMFADEYRQTLIAGRVDSRQIVEEEAWRDMSLAVAGGNRRLAADLNPIGSGYGAAGFEAGAKKQALFDRIAQARQTDKHALPGLPADETGFDAWVRGRVEREMADTSERLSRADGIASRVAGFAGGVAGSFTDPVNITLLPMGAPRAAGLLKGILVESALASGGYVAQTPFIATWRNQVGLDYTAADFLEGLGMTAALGAGFGLAAKAPHAIVSRLQKIGAMTPKELIAETSALKAQPSEARAARDILDAAEQTAQTNPLGDLPAASEEHLQRLSEAVAAVAQDRRPDLADEPLMPSLRGAEALPQSAGRWTGKPSDIGVDARRFQFKSGGDEAGVLSTLRSVKEWNPVLAGDLMLWQDRGGKVWVADGHQRLGLGRRLEAEGQAVEVGGPLFREADGVTADDVRIYAAFKNIVQGDPAAIDAAKIVREAPALFDHPSVPRTRELVRTAQDLARLSDDAFGLVVNEVVPANYARLVGRLAPDPATHAPLLGLLAKAEPANITEAESIIRQGLEAGGTREVQDSLFGPETTVHLLFKERARVLDATLKLLRRDRTVFSTLTNEADRIRAAGNVLAVDQNASRVGEADAALTVLLKLAHRKGPLADALNQAAAKARTEGVAAAARDFARSVAGAVEDGALRGVDAGADRSLFDAAPPARQADGGSSRQGDARLEAWSDPGQAAAADQVKQLERNYARDLETDPSRIEDIPVDPLTGDARPAADLFAEFRQDARTLSLLEQCMTGGAL